MIYFSFFKKQTKNPPQDSESSRENSPNVGKKTENEYKNGNTDDAHLSNTHAQWKKSYKPTTHSKNTF